MSSIAATIAKPFFATMRTGAAETSAVTITFELRDKDTGIEYRKEDPSIPISPLHKMTISEVRSELEPVGFHLVSVLDFLPTQHILIFQDARGRRR